MQPDSRGRKRRIQPQQPLSERQPSVPRSKKRRVVPIAVQSHASPMPSVKNLRKSLFQLVETHTSDVADAVVLLKRAKPQDMLAMLVNLNSLSLNFTEKLASQKRSVQELLKSGQNGSADPNQHNSDQSAEPVEIYLKKKGKRKKFWRCSCATGPSFVCTEGRSHSGTQGQGPADLYKINRHILNVHTKKSEASGYSSLAWVDPPQS